MSCDRAMGLHQKECIVNVHRVHLDRRKSTITTSTESEFKIETMCNLEWLNRQGALFEHISANQEKTLIS